MKENKEGKKSSQERLEEESEDLRRMLEGRQGIIFKEQEKIWLARKEERLRWVKKAKELKRKN